MKIRVYACEDCHYYPDLHEEKDNLWSGKDMLILECPDCGASCEGDADDPMALAESWNDNYASKNGGFTWKDVKENGLTISGEI